MEDNGRELDPDPIKTSPAKDAYPDSKKLTIMLIGSVGKMHSFKISRKLIIYASIFFLIYIVFSILVFYLYLDLYTAHKSQSDNLRKLEAELSDKTKALEQNKLYIQVLEDYRKGIDVKPEKETERKKTPEKSSQKMSVPGGTKNQKTVQKEPKKKATDTVTDGKKIAEQRGQEESSPGSVKSQKTVPKVQEEKEAETGTNTEQSTPEENVPGGTDNQATGSEETVTDTMEIRDINFRRTDSELTLNFVLANKLAEEKTAEGYIHIIVMNKNKECPPEWNIAYDKLSNGFPVDFNHGQEFIIQNYRPYQRKYKTISDSELPSFIRIIVYDRSGQKILEKEFPVTDESANDPS